MSETIKEYDVCVIGGGINGVGIARDAAGQGLSVALLEKGDLASATSSASSKFIHGGLRYLEYGAFSLVRKALIEREKLLRMAPHIIQPLSFTLPHIKDMRPFWMLRAGVMLYDALGVSGSSLARSKAIQLSRHENGKALIPEAFDKALLYSDCMVDDSRLVVLNAVSARDKGADIYTYNGCDYVSQEADHGRWRLRLASKEQIRARFIVNASGPWVRQFLGENGLVRRKDTPSLRLVKGSHIVLPQLYDGGHAYILQNNDGRVVFAWPYHGFTAIGTTDTDLGTDPDVVPELDQGEQHYLMDVAQRSFARAQNMSTDDIVSDWSGVRALFDNGAQKASSTTRDYKLYQNDLKGCHVLSVFGGKLTTYRQLSEDAVRLICKHFNRPYLDWTAKEMLPGGESLSEDYHGSYQKVHNETGEGEISFERPELFENVYNGKGFDAEKHLKGNMQALWERYGWLPQGLVIRYASSYGSLSDKILEGCASIADMGEDFGAGLYAREVDYLVQNEYAKTTEDILWRRTKLGLVIDAQVKEKLQKYIDTLL